MAGRQQISNKAAAEMCVRTPLLVLSLITLAAGNLDAWTVPQPPPKTLHTQLVSLDEKLSLGNAKWESTLREMEQRMESLESTFRRLDSTFQERLDKLERNLNSKELKDELMVEKLSHKMRDILDTSYDRYSRRLGYTEERLEMSLKKVQMSVEGILNRMEKQQEDIQTDVAETVAIIEDLRTADDKLNSTHKAIHQQIQQSLASPTQEELLRISTTLEHISTRLNGSLGVWGSQNDGPQTGDLLSTIRSDINSESTKITSKMNNMYNEMWRKVVSMESLLKDLGRMGNITRQEVLEEVRSLVPSDRDFPGESQENFFEILDALERKLQKLSRNLDDRMDSITARQDLVLDSCFEGGLCRGLESRLSQVLERIFEIFSDKIENSTNRTLNLDSLVKEMMELVKSQHSHLIRTVSHNTNMVVTLAKDSSDANKQLQYNVTQLATHYQELHNELETVSNSGWKLCTENTTNEIQKSTPFPSKNITEVKVTTFNITEQPNTVPKNRYDIGVLKITTDNLGTLSDNISVLSENTPRVVDNSIINIITTISPNLTSDQIESLLRVLNSSVSFNNLEAIIQNTEAEPILDGGSDELSDNQPNTTNTEDNFAVIEETNEVSTNLSGQKEHFSEDNTEDIQDQDITTENIEENAIISNDSVPTKTKIKDAISNKTGSTSEELSAELKDELKVYIFLWRIKYGYTNTTLLTQQLAESKGSDMETVKLLPVLKKLCYHQNQPHDYVNNTNLYGTIEGICNGMAQYIHRKNTNQDNISQNYN